MTLFSNIVPYKEETNIAWQSSVRWLANWLDITWHENPLSYPYIQKYNKCPRIFYFIQGYKPVTHGLHATRRQFHPPPPRTYTHTSNKIDPISEIKSLKMCRFLQPIWIDDTKFWEENDIGEWKQPSKSSQRCILWQFLDRVHVRLWLLSSRMVYVLFVMNHWSKWSQYKFTYANLEYFSKEFDSVNCILFVI